MFYREEDVMEALSEIYVDVLGSPVAERTLLRIKQTIRELETVDAEPVVRCRECKHRPELVGNRVLFPDHRCPCECYDDNYYSWMPDGDWFCKNGEREETAAALGGAENDKT